MQIDEKNIIYVSAIDVRKSGIKTGDSSALYNKAVDKIRNNVILKNLKVFSNNCIYNHEEEELINKAIKIVSKYS